MVYIEENLDVITDLASLRELEQRRKKKKQGEMPNNNQRENYGDWKKPLWPNWSGKSKQTMTKKLT